MCKLSSGSQINFFYLLLFSSIFIVKSNFVFSAHGNIEIEQAESTQRPLYTTRTHEEFTNHIWIDPATSEILPNFNILYGIFRGSNPEKIRNCIKSTQELFSHEYENARNKWKDLEASQIPELLNLKNKFEKIGKLPNSVSSIEKLFIQLKAGIVPEIISPLVDLYNAMSIKYGIPITGEDLKKISPIGEYSMILKISEGNEPYQSNESFSNQTTLEFPNPGQIIYADQEGMISQALYWRENARTRIDSSTTEAIFIAEATNDEEYLNVKLAISELGDLATSFCGGKFEVFSTTVR